MSFSSSARTPRNPTQPQGETIAAYATYLEAQRAVAHLADKDFPVQLVTIVGTDLRMVERVTGRLSYPRAALGGFLTGAWLGLFVGLLLTLFSTDASSSPMFSAILIGGAFGMLFSVVTYSLTRRRRDFTSTSQIVASSYALLCRAEQANKARNLLREIGGVQSGWPARPVTTTSSSGPPAAQPPAAEAPSVPPERTEPPSAPPSPPSEQPAPPPAP
ncbi:general stress protein [Cellulomonas sp. URHE0023]|uniref:general stress protein n=1 Tax=Cellulomonas sp. URHE0023 TaxID=1380354 RepID=UPI000550CBD5|nr:general stress protein [Cellulomonas sp. URHE0023]